MKKTIKISALFLSIIMVSCNDTIINTESTPFDGVDLNAIKKVRIFNDPIAGTYTRTKGESFETLRVGGKFLCLHPIGECFNYEAAKGLGIGTEGIDISY